MTCTAVTLYSGQLVAQSEKIRGDHVHLRRRVVERRIHHARRHALGDLGFQRRSRQRLASLTRTIAVAHTALLGVVLEIHPHDAEQRGVRDGDWVKLASRSGETTLKAKITERVAPGVVYTTFHHPTTQVNVVTTDFSDWATNCPEYKVTAVQVMPSNGPSEWQEEYEELTRQTRQIAEPLVAAE